jgi:hypothetical protein
MTPHFPQVHICETTALANLARCNRSSTVEDFLGLLALEILISVSAALALLLASGAGG